MLFRRLTGILFAAALIAAPAFLCAQANAQSEDGKGEKPEKTGKLPRFESLRAGEVNVRTGPGPRYPVDWVFVRRDLPVEVVAAFETWRKIRDVQNTEGWVHQSMLTTRRHVQITGEQVQPILRKPEDGAPVVAQVEPGVIAQLLQCENDWCRLQLKGASGWMKRGAIWGVYPDEEMK